MVIHTKSLDEGVAVLDLSGRLEVGSALMLRDAVCEMLATGRRHLVLNLIGLSDVDAAGLGELAHALKSVRAAGGELTLVVQSPIVRELLARTHLLHLFTIVPSEAPAIVRLEMAAAR